MPKYSFDIRDGAGLSLDNEGPLFEATLEELPH